MHPLDGAYEQINGAREHLDLLRPEIEDLTKSVSDNVSLKYEMGTVNIQGRQVRTPIGTAQGQFNVPAPLKVSRLVGATIQDLRTALDYLVYELACFDSKSIVEKTQFVIVDCEMDFRSNKRHLNGLTGEHIAMFERLQPYNGCYWTGLLRDLSNPAKHKHLTAIRQSASIRLSDYNTAAILAGKDMDVDDYATIKIAFGNGSPVIEGLEQLVLEVAHTLSDFKPLFK